MPNEAEAEHSIWWGGQEDAVEHHKSRGSCSSDQLMCGDHRCNIEGRLFLCLEICRYRLHIGKSSFQSNTTFKRHQMMFIVIIKCKL